jgi:hypothetical protein
MTNVDEVGLEAAIEQFVLDEYFSPTDWPKYLYKKLITALIEERKDLRSRVAASSMKVD